MPESYDRPDEETMGRVAEHLIGALKELQRTTGEGALTEARRELVTTRGAIESLVLRFERHLADDMEQRLQLAGQLTSLAGSLDRLVEHIQLLSEVVVGLMATPAGAAGPDSDTGSDTAKEPAFMPGGEGVTLSIASVPGFQSLMDLQKALSGLEAVAGASVERFQEGDSRLLLHLDQPISAQRLLKALHDATRLNFVVEESRPELMSLRLRVVST